MGTRMLVIAVCCCSPRLAARHVPERAARRPGPRPRHPEGGLGQSRAPPTSPACSAGGPARSCSLLRLREGCDRGGRRAWRSAAGAGAFALGVAAIVGHTFPIYRKGGKGVATGGRRARRAVPVDRRRPRGRVVRRRAAAAQGVARVVARARCCSRSRSSRRCGYDAWEIVDPRRARGVGRSRATSVTFDGCCGARRTISARVRADERTAHRRGTEGAPMQPVRKAVIPAAGLGTRFLPATKSSPKEMLPVVDRPAIQYVVEEAVQAGLTDILIITGRNKRAVEDHFDRNFELEHYLEATGKHAMLKEVQFASDLADIHYVRQTRSARARARGVGRASSRRRRAVRGAARRRPHGRRRRAAPVDARRATSARARRSSRCRRSRPRRSRRTAASSPRASTPTVSSTIRRIVEKPAREVAPSNLAVIGRYVFTPEIFDALDRIEPGAGGELQLTDAIALLLGEQKVFGCRCDERSLRRRAEARLPARQHRARARPRRPRARARGVARASSCKRRGIA